MNDKLWLWCHAAGSHDHQYNLPGACDITPVQAAGKMGIDNLIMVRYRNEPQPPLAPHAEPMRGVRRLVWSIIGDSSSQRTDQGSDVAAVIELAQTQRNVIGGIMDDFFYSEADEQGRISHWQLSSVESFRAQLNARHLELYTVLYAHQMHLPVMPYLAASDVITFWTWRSEDLVHLERNFARCEELAPSSRKLLGCYMWDYGGGKPMPLAAMQGQCELGARWLAEGRIDGLIFLASNLCGLEVETVAWTRDWVADHT